MAQDVVSGLFGMSPYQAEQQRYAEDEARAARFAQMPAVQRGVQGLMQGGAGLARLGAGAMGMVDPAVQAAQQQEEAIRGVRLDNPDSIRARARALEASNPQIAARLDMLANKREQEMSTMDLQSATAEQRRRIGARVEEGVGYGDPKDGLVRDAVYDETGRFLEWAGDPYSKKNTGKGAGGGSVGFVDVVDPNDPNKIIRVPNSVAFNQKLERAPYSAPVTANIAEAKTIGKNRPEVEKATFGLKNDLENLSSDIGEIINHPGLSGATGKNSYVPSIRGSDASKVEGLIESMQSKIMLKGKELAASSGGIGAITEKEWPLLGNAIANIDRTKGADHVKSELMKVRRRAEQLYAKEMAWRKAQEGKFPARPNVVPAGTSDLRKKYNLGS